MKNLKKKIWWLVVVLVVILFAIIVGKEVLVQATTEFNGSVFNFDSNAFLIAIGIEAFVTIHMSLFVLMPLSKIINSNKNLKVFGILFIVRIIILLIGDLFIPYVMMGVDFISVFLGTFILVPISNQLKKSIFKNGVRYSEYPEVEFDDLSRIGFTDGELLERALLQQYVEIKQSVCNFDYTKLAGLCTAEQYILYKNEMKLLEQVKEKNEFLDFYVKDSKITKALKDKNEINVGIVAKFECLEFTVDNYNKIVRGSDKDKKDVMVELAFHQKLNGNIIEVCPNCAAPVKEGHVEFCEYCGTALNFKVGDWVLVKENRVYEK